MPRLVWLILLLSPLQTGAEGLTPERLGVLFSRTDPASIRIAQYYAARRGVPAANLVGLSLPDRDVIDRAEFGALQADLLAKLPTTVQSLLLVWSRPYAVECMSVTTAFAAGYQPAFCEPGCGRTKLNPLYGSDGWLPAETIGWLPAMLLPSGDETLARAVIDRGISADGTRPPGTLYLVLTSDVSRNVRAARYADAAALVGRRVDIRGLSGPVKGPVDGIIGYFTGALRVTELDSLHFRPGAAADHLTSFGGVLDGWKQMPALDWLRQGATASYGTVSEPCNHLGKFPSPAIFMDRYLRGDTLLAAYWKSVAMPGQGLFIGEPLARPYAAAPARSAR